MTAHEKLIEELRAVNLAPKQSYSSDDSGDEKSKSAAGAQVSE